MAKTKAKTKKTAVTKAPVKKAAPKAQKQVAKSAAKAPKAVAAKSVEKAQPAKTKEKAKALDTKSIKGSIGNKEKVAPAKLAQKSFQEVPAPAVPVVLKAAPQEVTEKPKKTKSAKVDKSLLNLSDKSMAELQKKWTEYKEKYGKEKAPLYNMANTYEAAAPLQHKVLGWGFVVSVQNDRLEVLFESGSKTLISNYRPR